MAMIELNAMTFEIVTALGHVVVSWYHAGSAPWYEFAPMYQEAARRHPHVTFARVDAGREQQLAAWCRIREIPTMMAFRDGVLLSAHVGFCTSESLDALVHWIAPTYPSRAG